MPTGISQASVDFASRLSKNTGLDFYTALGWEAAEGGPPDNPLNVRPGQHYGNAIAAADETAKFLTSEDTAGYYRNIIAAAQAKYPSEDKKVVAEANAIAFNPHFNVTTPAGHKQYFQNIDSRALQALYEGIQPNSKISPGGDVKNPPDPNPLDPGGIFGATGDALGKIGNAFDWLTQGENWYRIAFFAGGGVLIILGLYEGLIKG